MSAHVPPSLRRSAIYLAAGLALVLVFLDGAARGAEAGWRDYVNVRFQYHLCYPAGAFVPQPEAPNGDGRRFEAADGAALIVYGRNNALDEGVKATAEATAARLAGDNGKTTYSAVRANGFAVSGTHGADIFYAKGLLKGQQYKIFETTYPAALAAKYNRIVEKIAACFVNTGR